MSIVVDWVFSTLIDKVLKWEWDHDSMNVRMESNDKQLENWMKNFNWKSHFKCLRHFLRESKWHKFVFSTNVEWSCTLLVYEWKKKREKNFFHFRHW